MCDDNDPFFLNALTRDNRRSDPSIAEYIIVFVFIQFVGLILWIMGYVAGLSNGESKAYKEILQSKSVTEEVQNETMADH